MIKKTAIIGMGALGTLYGDIIMRSVGHGCVEFIVDDARFERYKTKTTTVKGHPVDFKTVRAKDATAAGLVIVAVKFRDLESALDTMKNCVGENTVILSVMNGISSESIIAERYGADRVICTVARGMDAMKLGDNLTYSQAGNLHIGITHEEQKPYLDAVTEFFKYADVPHIVEDNIIHKLWAKFMLNVGVNLTSAAYGAGYGKLLNDTGLHDVMLGAMLETKALANAEGIMLTDEDIKQALETMGNLDPEAFPSTAQDVVAKRPAETDMFAGTVIEMSKKYSLKTPVNEDLYRRIKEIESEY